MRPETESGQEHLHLFRRRVLGLVENDIGVVERPSPHISERRHLDQAVLHVLPEILRTHDLVERVVQRPQIGIHLTLKVTGKKAEFLARFYSGSCHDDPLDLLVLERGDRHRHSKKGLSCSRRSVREYNEVVPDGIYVLLLSQCLGLDRLSADCVADDIFVKIRQPAGIRLVFHLDSVIYALVLDLSPGSRKSRQILKNPHSLAHIGFIPGHLDHAVPRDHCHIQIFLDLSYIVIFASKNIPLLLRG